MTVPFEPGYQKYGRNGWIGMPLGVDLPLPPSKKIHVACGLKVE